MTFVNIPAGDSAAYINEQKTDIQNDIAAALNQTGGVITTATDPTVTQIVGCSMIIAADGADGTWTLPNLGTVLPNGGATTVRLQAAQTDNDITLAAGANVVLATTQFAPGPLLKSSNTIRSFLVVQSGVTTTYYPVG